MVAPIWGDQGREGVAGEVQPSSSPISTSIVHPALPAVDATPIRHYAARVTTRHAATAYWRYAVRAVTPMIRCRHYDMSLYRHFIEEMIIVYAVTPLIAAACFAALLLGWKLIDDDDLSLWRYEMIIIT